MNFFRKICNDRGLSMVELVVAAGIAGIVVLGGFQVMKNMGENQADFTNKMSGKTLARMIESTLQTPDGCKYIYDREIDDEFFVRVGSILIAKDEEISGIKVESLRVDKFLPTDSTGKSGIADVVLMLSSKSSQRPVASRFLLAVNVESTKDYNLKIKSCNGSQQRSVNDIVDHTCGGAFGKNSVGLNCAEVVRYILTSSFKSVCRDLYGDRKLAKFTSMNCDLSNVHKNVHCAAGQAIAGFTDVGEPICRPTPTTLAPACVAWTSYEPRLNTVCKGKEFTQNRRCLDPGFESVKDSREVKGTKIIDCDIKRPCRAPASWSSGKITCLVNEPMEYYEAEKSAPVNVEAFQSNYTKDGQTFHNEGKVSFYCDEGNAVMTASTCTQVIGAGK